jgi:hypothetical protein
MALQKAQVFLLKGMLASNLSRDPFNRPAGTGLFPHDSRHFVPGYYRALPSGQSHSPIETPLIILAPMGLPLRGAKLSQTALNFTG